MYFGRQFSTCVRFTRPVRAKRFVFRDIEESKCVQLIERVRSFSFVARLAGRSCPVWYTYSQGPGHDKLKRVDLIPHQQDSYNIGPKKD